MATGNGLHSTTSTIHNGNILNKLHQSLKLLNIRPAPYVIMPITVILNTCHVVLTVFGTTENKRCLVSETVLFGEPAKLP